MHPNQHRSRKSAQQNIQQHLQHHSGNNHQLNGQTGGGSNGGGSGGCGGGIKSDPAYEACVAYMRNSSSGALAIEFPHINVMQVQLQLQLVQQQTTAENDAAAVADEITLDDVDALRSMYREHCEAFQDAVHQMEFGTVEQLWHEFWRTSAGSGAPGSTAAQGAGADECEEERYLSKHKLYALARLPAVQEFVRSVDYLFYQAVAEMLFPDVLQPIPSVLTNAIRNFSRTMEQWLPEAMRDCAPAMVEIKVGALQAFGQTLRRYTSLNHLACAARAVMLNRAQVSDVGWS